MENKMADDGFVDFVKTDQKIVKNAEISFKKPQICVKKPSKNVKDFVEEKSDENIEKNDIIPSSEDSLGMCKNSQEKIVPNITDSSGTIYKEPTWSGRPNGECAYKLEVLKNGSIIDKYDLTEQYYVIGRLPSCHICLQHPTVSRFHAVVQFRATPTDEEPIGFYILDFDSTHGTFLNKKRLKSNIYAPFKVGHMLRFGCSQRQFILVGPESDKDAESELIVTELTDLIKKRREKGQKKEKTEGINWGIEDDDDSDSDDVNNDDASAENPYASTTNEELYLDDPKKALKGYFEREGLDYDYNCTEQGIGQFLCKIELPMDDPKTGRPLMAECLHRGKKRDAIAQCALEACRILDRAGLLRNATHESRRRKQRNWQENDFYDSDDDTFLDRTGTVERKREKRIKMAEERGRGQYGGGAEKAGVETEQSLQLKKSELIRKMTEIEEKLANYVTSERKLSDDSAVTAAIDRNSDSLDVYMRTLTNSVTRSDCRNNYSDKTQMASWKLQLSNLKKSALAVDKLLGLVTPAQLPSLRTDGAAPKTSNVSNLKVQTLAPPVNNADKDEKKQIEKESEVRLSGTQKRKKSQKRELKKSERSCDKNDSLLLLTGADVKSEDYNMWLPPQNQAGDGRTTLNDKYGY